jgi:hypothetical protein
VNRLKNNVNPLNAQLNPICPLLALFGAHHILHVSRVRVKIYIKIDIKTAPPYFGAITPSGSALLELAKVRVVKVAN